MASKLDQNIYDVVTSSPHDMRIPARRKDAVYDEVGPGPGSSIPPPTTKPKPKTESKVKQQIARMESEPLNLRPDRPPLLRAGHPVVPKPPLKPSASLPDSVPPQLGQENGDNMKSPESFGLSDFVNKFSGSLPTRVTVQSGICTSTEEAAISSGDIFNIHFLKSTKVVHLTTQDSVQHGAFVVPLNSAVRFALLYNPKHIHDQARRGFIFESASDIILQKSLPKIVLATKSYQGGSPSSSVEKNEVLVIRKVNKPTVGQRSLKVFSLTKNVKKSLSPQCVGHFSTKPTQQLMLPLPDILQHVKEPFPSEALICVDTLVYDPLPEGLQGQIVNLTHSSVETSLVATPDSTNGGEGNGVVLDLPSNLDIDVTVDSLSESESEKLNTVTQELYDNFDPAKLKMCKPMTSNENYTIQSYFSRALQEEHKKVGIEFERPKVVHQHSSRFTSTEPGKQSEPSKQPEIPPRYSRGSEEMESRRLSDIQVSSDRPRPQPPPKPGKKSSSSIDIFSTSSTSPSSSPSTSHKQAKPVTKTRVPLSVPQNRRFSYNSPSSSHTSDPTIPNQPQTPPPSHRTTTDRDTSSHLTNGTTASDHDGSSSTSAEETSHSEPLPPPNRIPATNHPLKSGNIPEPVPTNTECYTRPDRSSPKNDTDEPDSSPPCQRPVSAVTKTRGSSEARSSSSSIDANSLGNLAIEITSLQMNAKCLEDRTSALETNGQQTTEDISSLRAEVSQLVSSIEQLAERQEAMDSDIKRLKKKLDALSQQGANGATKSQGQGNIKEKNRQYLSSLSCKQILKLLHLMGLAQYSDSFRQEQISGELLMECDEALLERELGIKSRLHRVRLLRFISGQSSTQTLLEGQ